MLRNLFLCLIIFTAYSCSSDNDDGDGASSQNSIKPLSYTVAEGDDNSFTVNFEYTGNLVSRITTSFGSSISYNYSSGRLERFTSTSSGGSSSTSILTYEGDRLIEISNEIEGETFSFTYNSSGLVETSFSDFDGFDERSQYTYDSNGNIILETDLNTGRSIRTSYGTNNSPARNIFPQIDAEIGYPWLGGLVNNELTVERMNSDGEFEVFFSYEYEFNDEGYPLVRRQLSSDGDLRETVTYNY